MQAEEYERIARCEKTHWWYRALRRLLLADIAQAAPSVLLDAGCGTGYLLSVAGNGAHAFGVDMSREALRIASLQCGCILSRSSVTDLPYRDGFFDLVTCVDVLYHQWVPDELAAIREFQRVLKPGGVLLLHVPALEALRGNHDRVVFTRKRFGIAEVRSQVETAGFRIERITYRNSLVMPLMLLKRRYDRKKDSPSSDLKPPSWVVNAVLGSIMSLEHFLLCILNMPIGSSIYCRARKAPEY